MSVAYPDRPYRRHSQKRIQQGDVAIAEVHQLRARSGEPVGPGPPEVASDRLPFFGDFTDHRVSLIVGGKQEDRVLRIWSGPVMVLHQNCEVDFADENDTRLQIAPIATSGFWPEGHWDAMRENKVPGFLYLPAATEEQFNTFGVTIPGGWPESVVCMASRTTSSVGVIKPRREFSLAPDVLPFLQDAMVRFDATRGFADFAALNALRGKRIVAIKETGQQVRGPSSIVKVFLGDNPDEVDDGDDEASVTYLGVRPNSA